MLWPLSNQYVSGCWLGTSRSQVFYSAVEPAIGVRNTVCPRLWLEGGWKGSDGKE